MKNKFQVVVLGAGPAGLFACYELVTHGLCDILLIDRGPGVLQRNRTDDILYGVGGAGLFSDGKLNFTARRGKTDLTEFLTLPQAEKLVDYVEQVFIQFGMDGPTYPSNQDEAEEIKGVATRLGMNLLMIKQKHLGSDLLPTYIQQVERFLQDQGVTMRCDTTIQDILTQDGQMVGVCTQRGERIEAKHLIVAPGRSGNRWLSNQLEGAGCTLEYQAIEVGVRVEVPAAVLADITRVFYDPALFFCTQTYDDELRTFCTNPVGFVARENYQDFACVNGHACKNSHSANSNFALLNMISLSEPITNTIAYGESICKLANTIGAGKPLIQRYADFRRHRRTTWHRVHKGYIEPTLQDVTPGDIGMALPYRVVCNLVEGLERIDKLIPGVASDSTLLYAPEVKFHSCRPKVDANLETEIPNLYVAGDGAGVSGNIVGAAATGMIVAREIVRKAQG